MSKQVTVACKIPNGILLQLRSADGREVLGQARLKGSVDPGTIEHPGLNTPMTLGVGLTSVDADFWEAFESWAITNKYAPFINGYIFASDKRTSVEAEAKEREKEFNGFSGLQVKDPAKDARLADVRGARLEAFKDE